MSWPYFPIIERTCASGVDGSAGRWTILFWKAVRSCGVSDVFLPIKLRSSEYTTVPSERYAS